MMRRLGQRWSLSGRNVEYDILVGDFCRKINIHTPGLQTNHVYRGTRSYQVHFTPAPLYWGAATGDGSASYGRTDGSVFIHDGFTYATIGAEEWTAYGSIASGMYYPKELAKEVGH